jgi:hypothetical protein
VANIDFKDDALWESSLEQLIRAVHDTPKATKPQIGRNPYVNIDHGPIDALSESENPGKNTALQPEERQVIRQKLEEYLRTLESIQANWRNRSEEFEPLNNRWC